MLVFRAQRLTGGVAFAAAASRISARLPARSPAVLPPPPAELALSPLADMADIKNSPEYAAFFAVVGASAAMVFSGEHRSQQQEEPGGGGAPKRCGTRARCSLGAGRDVTVTSPGPVGVGPGGWGVSPMAAGTVEWEAHRGWRAGSGCGFRQPAGRASSVRGWGGGVAAILAPASRHEGGVGARGGRRTILCWLLRLLRTPRSAGRCDITS